MTMNLGLRRIASLSAFLAAVGIASTSQAGIIPWAYDVIFGPVHYPAYGYGYSEYRGTYSRPVYVRSSQVYAPASYGYSSGCSTCATNSYAPVSYGCRTVVVAPSCGPCGTVSYAPASGCLTGCAPAAATAPATNGKSAWNSTKKSAEPGKDPALTPRTFQNPERGASPAGATSNDGLETGIRSRGTRANENSDKEVEVNRPAPTTEEPTIRKPQKAPTKSVDDLDLQLEPTPAKPEAKSFEPPLENNKPASDATDGQGETTIRRALPKLNLDSKIAGRTELQRTRVPFHAKLAKASVTRRTPSLDSEWTPVVAKQTATQLVRK